MFEEINKYYQNSKLPMIVIRERISSFERNPDIGREFEYWIKSGKYLETDCVVEQGYTARRLADLSELAAGPNAFILLIELREKPLEAQKRIQRGFKVR